MKRLVLVFFMLVSMSAAAQQRFYISPAVGSMMFGSGAEKEWLYSELTVGYELSSKLRLDLAGGYGSRNGNSLYTSALSVTPMIVDFKRLVCESSIGVGFQKRSVDNGMKFVVPVAITSGYNFTPSFRAGVYLKSFVSRKNYMMTFTGISLAFRL